MEKGDSVDFLERVTQGREQDTDPTPTEEKDVARNVMEISPSKDGKNPVLIINTSGSERVAVESIVKEVVREESLPFGLDLYDFTPRLTPSNLHPKHWIEIGRAIENHYRNHQGFVIIHDLDVMAYTATGLSFVLEHVGKPVILTGGPDMVSSKNLLTSLRIAAHESDPDIPLVPEVCIFFKDLLIRGNRACFVSSYEEPRFESPFYPPLGKADENRVRVSKELVRSPSDSPLRIADRFETNILSFEIFPGVPYKILTHSLDDRQIKGVILKTFGSSFLPAQVDEDFLRVIKSAKDRGIPVVNVTSHSGKALEKEIRYNVNAELSERGIVNGLDMTLEAAVCKLMYILGSGEYGRRSLATYMQIDHRGEQSLQIYNIDFGEFKVGEAESGRINEERATIPGRLRSSEIYSAIFRSRGLEVRMTKEGSAPTVKFFLNKEDADMKTSEEIPNFIGRTPPEWDGSPINLSLDVRKQVQTVVDPNGPVHSYVVTDQPRVIWKEMKIEVYSRV